MSLTVGYRALVAAAEEEITTISPAQARQALDDADTLFVDVRDVREVKREGKIPGAFHAPRGMLEFWVDPESPYYKEVFQPEMQLVIYCNKGWRSALAAKTLQDMGVQRVCHIAGGFGAWLEAEGPVEQAGKA